MDKFLQSQLPKWAQEELENLNRHHKKLSSNYKSSHKEKPRLDGFTGKFYRTFEEEIIQILHNLIQRRKNTSHLILWGQYYPDTKARQRHYTRTEDYRPISLMNICHNISSKPNSITYKKDYIQHRIIQYTTKGLYKVRFSPGMQGWLNIRKSTNVTHCINKEQNHTIISIDAEINIWQNPAPFMIENSNKPKNKRKLPQPNKMYLCNTYHT